MVENLENIYFIFSILFLRLFVSSYLRSWNILHLPFITKFSRYLLRCRQQIEIKEFHVLKKGGENTCKDASRHRRTCGVLKCSICNFYTYSSVELTYHIKKKAFFVNESIFCPLWKGYSAVSKHTPREDKLSFLKNLRA